jgi:hypothetical protein
MSRLKVCLVAPDHYGYGFTTTPGPELGLFRLRGMNLNLPVKNHQFILTGVQDLGHSLLIHVFYGGRERFVIENISDPTLGAVFSYKHSGASKKNFKPGDIVSPAEIHTLTWTAPNSEGVKSLITLTLIPLFSIHGLRVHYTVKPEI